MEKVEVNKTKAGELTEEKYETMYDYIKDWDITHYARTGEHQEDVLIVGFRPCDDHNFIIDYDDKKHAGYIRVNSGEKEASYLKEDALDEECYVLYQWDEDKKQYFSDGIVYDTEEDAEKAKKEVLEE